MVGFAPRFRLTQMQAIWLVVILSAAIPLQAQPEPTFSPCPSGEPTISQQDLNGDNQPDLAAIDCNFHTSNDRIWVYDQGQNMQAGTDWRAITDFIDDVWLFDVNADALPELVIRFTSIGADTLSASIYVDQNGDGTVSVALTDNIVDITEGPFPPIRATVTGGWFLPDGQLNWNVTFETDGDFVHRRNAEIRDIELLGIIDRVWQPFLIYDGSPDMEFEFHDDDFNGIPEYYLWRLLTPTPASSFAARARIWSNVGQHRPLQPTGYLFWPYLVPSLDGFSAIRNYFDGPPGIAIDWDTLLATPPLFFGYPIEIGFHVHNLQYFTKGVVNYADFEIAQAYYDLAQDNDTFPELHIRHRFFAFEGDSGPGANEIRWSWNQFNTDDLIFDFKLGLAGRHAITTEVDFPDFAYRAVPYEQLPQWIVDHDWDIATFIDVTQNPYKTSEGIYEWGPVETEIDGDNTVMTNYLIGEDERDIRVGFRYLPVGLRGEFAPNFQSKPYLYFSPIDAQLHLVGAEYGLWNMTSSAQLRYYPLDNDPYLDHWIYTEGSTPRYQLIHTDQYLFYSGQDSILIKQATVPPALFTVLPPITHAEWSWLGEMLESHDRAFPVNDLRAMVEQFEGNSTSIEGGTLSDFALLPDGFRFTLSLQPGFTLHSNIPELNIDTLSQFKPGDYRFEYTTDAGATITPMTPPELTLTISESPFVFEEPTAHVTTEVYVTVSNAGFASAHDLSVSAFIRLPDQSGTYLGTQSIAVVPGESQATVRFPWTPDSPGTWELHVTLSQYDASLARELQQLAARSGPLPYNTPPVRPLEQLVYMQSVQPALSGTLSSLLSAFGLVPAWTTVALAGTIILTSVLVILITLHNVNRTEYTEVSNDGN